MCQFTSLIEGPAAVHTTSEKSSDTQLYFYGFAYVYANRRQKNGAIKKHFSNGRNFKKTGFASKCRLDFKPSWESGCLFSSQRLREDGNVFENDEVTIIKCFACPSFLQTHIQNDCVFKFLGCSMKCELNPGTTPKYLDELGKKPFHKYP